MPTLKIRSLKSNMAETNSTRVKVQSLLSIVSSTPTEPGKVHEFSLLDRSMGLHTLHLVFYYNSNPFNDGPMPSDLDNLRVSLSKLLDQYPLVTGRLTRDPDHGGWGVKCNDAGVRMLQASVSVSVDEWLRSADEAEERDLTVWEEMPDDPSFWSPFRIQINSFKCGGLAIGVSCTHMHADITSVTMLIKSWAEAHRGLPLTHPPTFQVPASNISTPPLATPKCIITPSKMATMTMKFGSPSIEKCLNQAKTRCPKANPFDVLVSLLWTRIARWQEPLPEANEHELSICVDLRNRGNPPLVPLNYFGNAYHFSSLSLDSSILSETGALGSVAQYVHNHVEDIKGGDYLADMAQLESLGKEGKGPNKMYGPGLTCVDMGHMANAKNGVALMYTAMFKDGEKPAHVSYRVENVEGEGLIMVMPSGEPGLGLTVTVTLPEEQIASLSMDQVILELEPTLIISGRK